MAAREWRHFEVRELAPPDRRLVDLALAGVIPWGDGYPQYWTGGEVYSPEWCARVDEVEKACKDEKLPWEL